MIEWLQGKKTYIVAAIVGIRAALAALGYDIPVWVDPVLIALGLTTLRAGISNK